MNDLIERLKGPFKYHDNMLCVPESLIEDCGRALSPALPDDVQALVNRELPALIMALETGKINSIIASGEAIVLLKETVTIIERLARENAAKEKAYHLRGEEIVLLQAKVEELEKEKIAEAENRRLIAVAVKHIRSEIAAGNLDKISLEDKE